MTWMLVLGVIVLFSGGAGAAYSCNDEDDWVASEMNKEGMNYKE